MHPVEPAAQCGDMIDPRASARSSWTLGEAAIVGVLWYTSTLSVLLLSMFALPSIPSLYSILRFYQLDAVLPEFVGVVGGVLFAGPLVMWIIRRRKVVSLDQSIRWDCSNRVFGWSFLCGFLSGIAYSLAKSAVLGRGYEKEGRWYIVAFVALAVLAQPAVEELYFRGILFTALAGKVGNIFVTLVVTFLFCVAHPRQQFFTVLPVAILLGGIRLHTGSVRACFACHAAYNLSLILFMIRIHL